MTKSKAIFGLLAIAVAGGAAAFGIVGTDALAKWFPPLKWLTGDAQCGRTAVARFPGVRVRERETGA